MPGRVIGLVQGRRRPPSDLMVFSMWVDPTSRRLGLGRRLIEAVEGWARGWGGSRVVLWVYSGNESAMRFYRRLGFDLVRVGPDADAGVPHGALAMERALTG
jgi:GNAT superfamily N-acetyltransferase